jgi:hypothetical protein
MTTQPFKSIVLNLLQQGHQEETTSLQELGETECSVIGTWELWSVKDHVAHRMFWHQDLISKLTALLEHREIPIKEESDDQLNAITFEKYRLHPWSEIHSEAEQVYAELIKLIEHFNEEDLMTPVRFFANQSERPLYAGFLGPLYEHDLEHLAQYYADHHHLARAIEIREKCASRVLESELPEWIKGNFCYNLACFYSHHNMLEQAAASLEQAIHRSPRLKELSQNDPDLVALRNQ